ncbi:MAG: hypothetical protein OXE46_03445 [Chloroflexi bacterium]|nr:hypothetical protein [Chloroflexota bacterium]
MKNQPTPPKKSKPVRNYAQPAPGPTSNFTLSSVCPACNSQVVRLRCKVLCQKCGFVWDCSEL